MAVPKKRMSKSKSRQRRSHDALRAPTVGACPQCGADRLPHRACAECGHYRGRQIFAVEKEEEA
jgi:large subunit ribosomal protein L32